MYQPPEYRFICIAIDQPVPADFEDNGHYERAESVVEALDQLRARRPEPRGMRYVLDEREVPFKPAIIQPREIVAEETVIWCAEACSVFLGHYGNFDLYGDPESGRVITRPVVEGCRSSTHGDRLYFRSTRALGSSSLRLNRVGMGW